MVSIEKDKEDVDSNKRPTPYSLPPKPNWKSLFNGTQILPQKLSMLRPSELKVSNKPPPLQNVISPISPESPSTSAQTFPVPMPRKTSSSDSTPHTPVPLPRTIFNLPPIDSTSVLLGRSTSLPTERKEPQVKLRLAHSLSDPPNQPVKKDDPGPALPKSPITTPLEDLNEEEDGDTWL
ncbi:hypothetical protein OUZ56_023074 [Daphnia magna]|uniref:Uncharacterized protein n=1 Tax=Daphnia magna TaxID=35525 RepID=A0ABR0AY95_9CRUS|nr:hypothetical protein OUZ56_023074 [Daphnia magna]